jgi:hypothetical protein
MITKASSPTCPAKASERRRKLPSVGGSSVPFPIATLAFTRLELLIVIAVLALLGTILIAAIAKSRQRSLRITCTCNLKQIGLASRIWSGDHMDRYPMEVLTNRDGSLVFPNGTNAYRYFAAMSNELNTPIVLACPADKERSPAKNWASLSNSNLSYFLGLDADETEPAMLLAGDRNVTNGAPLTNGILTLSTNRPTGWTTAIHGVNGNVALADGSVMQLSSARLRDTLAASGTNLTRLLVP